MLADFETRILTKIDDMVEHASDDELFAGGYLRGHLTLLSQSLNKRMKPVLMHFINVLKRVFSRQLKGESSPHQIKCWF